MFIILLFVLALLLICLTGTKGKKAEYSHDNKANWFVRDIRNIIGGPEYIVVPDNVSYIGDNTIHIESKNAKNVYLEIINLLSTRIYMDTNGDVNKIKERLLIIAHDLKYITSEDLKESLKLMKYE